MRAPKFLILAALAAQAAAAETAEGQAEIGEQRASGAPAQAVPGRLRWLGREARAPVAYDTTTGHILFRVAIGGRDTWALLDNGSEGTLIDLALAQQLGLRLGERTGRLVTTGGTLPTRSVHDVPLAIPGQFEARAPVLAGVDLRPLSTLLQRDIGFVLGGDFLHRVTLQVDPARRELNLSPSGALRAPPTAPFLTLRDGRPQVEVQIGGRPVILTVDLGDSALISLTPEAWARVAPPDAETRPMTHRQADGALQTGQTGRLPELRIGPVTIRNVPVSVRPLNARMADGTLGMGFFGRVGFVLDVGQGKLWVRPLRPEAPPR